MELRTNLFGLGASELPRPINHDFLFKFFLKRAPGRVTIIIAGFHLILSTIFRQV